MGKNSITRPARAAYWIILHGLLNIVDALKAIHSATDTTEHTWRNHMIDPILRPVR